MPSVEPLRLVQWRLLTKNNKQQEKSTEITDTPTLQPPNDTTHSIGKVLKTAKNNKKENNNNLQLATEHQESEYSSQQAARPNHGVHYSKCRCTGCRPSGPQPFRNWPTLLNRSVLSPYRAFSPPLGPPDSHISLKINKVTTYKQQQIPWKTNQINN